MQPILALRHAACEGPGRIQDLAAARGIEVRVADLPQQFPRWPEPAQYSAVLVLGGPMSIQDSQRYGWLKTEIRLLRRSFDEGVPILGICLGAQLLAASYGARVYPGRRKEIGWGEIRLRRAAHTDPLFEGLPSRFTVFHWHGDTFDLPEDSQILASSSLHTNQAFRVGERSYGFQFHLEVTKGMPEAWAKEYASELERTGGPTVGGTLDDSDWQVEQLAPIADHVFGRWLDLVSVA